MLAIVCAAGAIIAIIVAHWLQTHYGCLHYTALYREICGIARLRLGLEIGATILGALAIGFWTAKKSN